MSMRREALYFIKCDGCGVEHHDPQATSALEARVLAGIVGWSFRQGKPGRNGKGAVEQRDTCAGCGGQVRQP